MVHLPFSADDQRYHVRPDPARNFVHYLANKPLGAQHYIGIGHHGTFQESGVINSSPAQIDGLFQYLADNHVTHLVLYFHGGLVSEQVGQATAESLTQTFLDIDVHPIFFIWKTGPKETINTILEDIANILTDDLVKKLRLFILQQVTKRWGKEVGGKGAGQAMSYAELDVELGKDRPFEDWDNPTVEMTPVTSRGGDAEKPLDAASLNLQIPEIEAELDETINTEAESLEPSLMEAADNKLLNPELREAGFDTRAKGIDPRVITTLIKISVQVTVQVLRRRSQGLDHGLFPTVIEELLRAVSVSRIGKVVWDVMKNKAAEMWLPNAELIETSDLSNLHVGTYFVKRLMKYIQKYPETTVDLIGHSAGSIAICNLLKHAAQNYPSYKFGRIVLLAPGATMSLFNAELISHPERYESLRMYIMSDELECKDAIAGPLYPRSLLYFVSGVLEDSPAVPLSGLARCFSGIAPYQELLAIRDYLYAEGQNRIVLSKAEGMALGLNSLAEHHGDFDNDATTRASIQAYLKR